MFVTWLIEPKRLNQPALDPGSPAQASLSTLRFLLSKSPADLLDYVARKLAGRSTDPAWLKPKFLPKLPDVPRPFLG